MPGFGQFIAVNLQQVEENIFSWVLQSNCIIENSKIKTIQDTLPFPGVKQGGTYLFLRALSPIGFITGTIQGGTRRVHPQNPNLTPWETMKNSSNEIRTLNAPPCSGVFEKTAPLTPAKSSIKQEFFGGSRGATLQKSPPAFLVFSDNHQITAISSTTNSYVQTGFVGNFELTAKDPVKQDTTKASGTIHAAGEIVHLDIAIAPTGPKILAITPQDGAQKVPLASTISVIFSEAIDAVTFNNNNFYAAAGTNKIVGVYKLNSTGTQGEILPHTPLPSDTVITISGNSGIKDLQGNPLSPAFSSSFRTIDTTPPVVDTSLISVRIPVNGKAHIVGIARDGKCAAEPGSTVIAINMRTGV